MSKGHRRTHPWLSQPFPRDVTAPVRTPAYDPARPDADARSAWFAWLRVLSQVTPMHLPPGHHARRR